jgi:SAM-dependent methyltransferase
MSDTAHPTVLFDFSDKPLDFFAAACSQDELWPVVQEVFPKGSSILEAGAGSGRWIKFLNDNGYRATGIELNSKDVARFRGAFPDLQMDEGDVRTLPYSDESFDAIMSLGVLEHMIDGPAEAPREMHRVLKKGGVVIFTVPHSNPTFQVERVKDPINYWLLGSNALRSLLGRRKISYTRASERERVAEVKARANPQLPVKYLYTPEIGTDFYEYRFTRAQAAQMMRDAGFTVSEIRLLYNKDRIFHILGRLAGSYDGKNPVRLNPLGRLIKSILPQTWTSHMVLVIAHKA